MARIGTRLGTVWWLLFTGIEQLSAAFSFKRLMVFDGAPESRSPDKLLGSNTQAARHRDVFIWCAGSNKSLKIQCRTLHRPFMRLVIGRVDAGVIDGRRSPNAFTKCYSANVSERSRSDGGLQLAFQAGSSSWGLQVNEKKRKIGKVTLEPSNLCGLLQKSKPYQSSKGKFCVFEATVRYFKSISPHSFSSSSIDFQFEKVIFSFN